MRVYSCIEVNASRKWGGLNGRRKGHWLLVIGYWSLVIGHWSLVIGHWSLVIGHWSLVIGHWLLVIGYWSAMWPVSDGMWPVSDGKWPVSDRATRPTEGLPYRGRPSVGGFGGVGDPRRTRSWGMGHAKPPICAPTHPVSTWRLGADGMPIPTRKGTRFPTRLGARRRCSDTRRFRPGFLLRGPLQTSWNTSAIPQKTHVSIELPHGRPTGASLRFPEAISSFRDDAERLPFPRNSGSVFRRAPHALRPLLHASACPSFVSLVIDSLVARLPCPEGYQCGLLTPTSFEDSMASLF